MWIVGLGMVFMNRRVKCDDLICPYCGQQIHNEHHAIHVQKKGERGVYELIHKVCVKLAMDKGKRKKNAK